MMTCEHDFVKEEGVMMLVGGVSDLAEEEVWRCTKCGMPDYRATGEVIDLLDDLPAPKESV